MAIQTVGLAAATILLFPVEMIADFFYAWAAVGGDTGVPATAGAIDREWLCFTFALASAVIAIVAMVAALSLPSSQRGLAMRRVARVLAAGAFALGVIGLLCIA
jgi:hypothetical protein